MPRTLLLTLCGYAILVFFFSTAGNSEIVNRQPQDTSLPVNKDRKIIDAVVSNDGAVEVVTIEPLGGDKISTSFQKYLLRFVTSDYTGIIHGMATIEITGIDSLRVIMEKGGIFVLGYESLTNRIFIIERKENKLVLKYLLKYTEGFIQRVWLIKVPGGEKVFVLKQDPQCSLGIKLFGEQMYGWLYCYNFVNSTLIFERKVYCSSNISYNTIDYECAGHGNEIFIWRIKGKASLDGLQVARWKEGGTLKWIDRYTGKNRIQYGADASDGAMVVVSDWENVENPFTTKIGLLKAEGNGFNLITLKNGGVGSLQLVKLQSPQFPLGLLCISDYNNLIARYDAEMKSFVIKEYKIPGFVDGRIVRDAKEIWLAILTKDAFKIIRYSDLPGYSTSAISKPVKKN